MRVLVTAVALPGHYYPLVPLAWALRAAGHEVLVAVPDSFVPAVLRSGLPAVPCGPAAGVADLAGATTRARTESEVRYAHGRAFARMARRNLPGVEAVVRSWQPDLVISDRAEFAGPLAADRYGVPHVQLHWGVPELPEYQRAAARELAAELAELGRVRMPAPAAVLDPWPPSLRQRHAAWHGRMRYVPYNGDSLVPAWALGPRRRPRICVTLGTVLPRLGAGGGAAVVVPMLRRLADLGAELVVAVDDEVAAGWPALPDAVRHAGRLPLSPVLAACDLAVNHGGNGSTLTALQAGTPQLVLPHFDDQFDNAAAVVAAGAGLRLLPDEVTPEAVADRCARLLATPAAGAAADRVAAEMADQPSSEEVVEMLAGLAAGAVALSAAA